MDIKKLAPWNWFKKEEEDAGKTVPVMPGASQERGAHPIAGPLSQLHEEIDRFFNNTFRGFGMTPSGFGSPLASGLAEGLLKPTVDISATEKEYKITVEVPGVDEKDVKLELLNDTLTISGEKKQEKEEKGKNYYCMERSYGTFQRTLSLPEDAEQEKIQASFKRGILNIQIPRKPVAESHVKRIEIKKN